MGRKPQGNPVVGTAEHTIAATLNILLISDYVGKFLRFDDLKCCRLVCRSWYTWSTIPFQKVCSVILRRIGDIQKAITYNEGNYALQPNSSFTLTIPLLTGKAVTRNLDQFWESVSATLTSLSVKNVEVISVEILFDILYDKTPNLKRLSLQDCLNNVEGVEKLLHGTVRINRKSKLEYLRIQDVAKKMDIKVKLALLGYIFCLHPNLQVLRIRDEFHTPDYKYLVGLLMVLAKIKKVNPRLYNLKELHLIDAFCQGGVSIPSYFVKCLQVLNFPLEVLTISTGYHTPESVISQLVGLYQSTIKKLDIISPRGVNRLPGSPFNVQLNNLKVLRIAGTLCENLRFLKFMPNLQILHICVNQTYTCHFSNQVPFPEAKFGSYLLNHTKCSDVADSCLEKLKELRIDHEVTATDIKFKLAKWFPNVERLILAAVDDTNGVVKAILNCWPNLKELYIRIGRRSDNQLVKKYPKLKELNVLKIFNNSSVYHNSNRGQLYYAKEGKIPNNHGLPDVSAG